MQVNLILADAAQTIEGKLYLLGGGWTVTGPNPVPQAVAAIIQTSWDETNVKHHASLALRDADGSPVNGPDGNPIQINLDFEVGRPAGAKAGSSFNVPLAVNFAPLPVSPGFRYEWELSIDGKTKPEWRVVFDVRPLSKPKAA